MEALMQEIAGGEEQWKWERYPTSPCYAYHCCCSGDDARWCSPCFGNTIDDDPCVNSDGS